ncbi:ead/Ea22-like family protein [Citrobacter sp. 50677481]|uniref:ead/Ea22-like family protein n=1 Tax=Citrobacter sp. 50677481 TaxID=1736699 RepID=UPI000741D2F9|nr:ead/Ea22-like family protein [Citrobacter sp. 50677481]KSY33608.1 hypothetical protein APU02_01385 [Citrobacter sp. 50677481]HCQ7755482.1 ead/Ea22-like family protein [Citrobacter sedlakii]
MTIDKQALRKLAKALSGKEWVAFVHKASGTYAVGSLGHERGEDIIKWPGLDGQDNAESKAKYIAAANPATVLALLDELEAAKELVELQRFKLERQAEDLHQAKSLESIHRDKRFEVEQEFRDYKDRADSNQMRLAKEVCRLEDALHAAGIGKGE